uniref:Anoctamin n=2 Tax=Cacopsylla melanoneura TaxID=428564 RepID=A0A8D8YM26_9HEMI
MKTIRSDLPLMETVNKTGEVMDPVTDNENGATRSNNNSGNGLFATAKESFESASRLLRRKIPRTGHLMTPRRLWINTVPTHECDIVIMFPPKTEDMELMWMLSQLRSGTPGLIVQVKHHPSTDSYGLYLTAPFSLMLKTAEELHLPKRLKQDHGGGLKEFVQLEMNLFETGEEMDKDFFTTQERQWMVYHLLHTLRASANDQFGTFKFVEGQAIIPKCLSEGLISQIYPLHDLDALQQLRQSWVRTFVKKQPLDAVCKYFGVKIAMYFAWLGHYTFMLIIPAFMGFIFWIGFGRGDQSSEDIGYVLFSLFNVIWFSIYLEAWKRYSSELAYKWGTLDQRHELLMEPRPLYFGNLERSPVTGRLEPTYPAWKRRVFRYFVTVPVIVLCLTVVLSVMIISLKSQDWWDKHIQNEGYYFWLSYLPKVLLAVIITLLDEAYYKVALWLNDMENYRLDTKYENQLIVKVALFQFVNSFSSLFYIAFYLQDQERLKEQLATLLITRQLIGNIKESALPYLQEQFRLAKLSFDLYGALSPSEAKKVDSDGSSVFDGTVNGKPSVSGRNVSQAELEGSLIKYEGTFADHLEMFIQLGYVVLFSCAFPLAALCALLNNLIEIRSDAFKLSFIFQRPIGERIPNIGMWQNAMEVMSLVSVLVNCGLIGLSGQVHRMFPEMSRTQTILLIVALEHIMLTVRFVISCIIPDLPDWVATEMAKVEFARREALSRISSTAVTPGLGEFGGGENKIHVHHVASNTSVGRFTISPLDSELVDPEDTPLLPQEQEELIIFCAEDKPPAPILDPEPPKPSPTAEPTQPSPAPELTQPSPASESTQPSSAPDPTPAKSITPKRAKPRPIHLNHMTISHGIDWMRRLKLDPMARRITELDNSVNKSTDCLPSASGYSVSEMNLQSPPHWHEQQDTSASDTSLSSETFSPPSSSLPCTSATGTLSKRQKVKNLFMKRAKSIAVFSLKLKEKRAQDAELQRVERKEKIANKQLEQMNLTSGGELSCIPLDKLICVDSAKSNFQPH